MLEDELCSAKAERDWERCKVLMEELKKLPLAGTEKRQSGMF